MTNNFKEIIIIIKIKILDWINNKIRNQYINKGIIIIKMMNLIKT
jgi:hypothetical protein